jgi:aerobic-type carbon monoxide dehydrogenase small subunit (CoxS/CutS family)
MDARDSRSAPARSISFTLNGRAASVTAPETTPLLDAPRNRLHLKAARFGRGVEQRGCRMVQVDGSPEKSRRKTLWAAAHRTVAGCAVGGRVDGVGSQPD